MILTKAWNKWRAAFRRELPKTEPAPQPAPFRPLKADGPFSPQGPEPDQTPAPGASVLDAGKVRESALGHPPDPPKPDGFPFPKSPEPPKPSSPTPLPATSIPGRLVTFPIWFLAVAAATIGLAVWLFLSADSSDRPGTEKPNAARSGPAEPASAQLVKCPSDPVVPVTGDKDGQLPLQADVSGLAAVDIASFVILSNEASAAGRERDAEVGLLMSCRIADQFKGAASVESADAKYRLGLHYAYTSLHETPAAALQRAELLGRAQILLTDSLLTYTTRFGDNDDRSRLVASVLASVRQRVAQKTQPEPAPPVSPDKNGLAGADNLPTPSRPSAAQAPASPSPAIEAGEKPSQIPPATKQCPPAVATLGLCD